MALSRRTFLRLGAATGGAAVAGCSNPLGGSGPEAEFGD